MITIEGQEYELVKNYRNCFDEEKFKSRFSENLLAYDYIVADQGHGVYRLKGFYEDNHRKATYDNSIRILDEYLYEYCNFGCKYFVLKKIKHKGKK